MAFNTNIYATGGSGVAGSNGGINSVEGIFLFGEMIGELGIELGTTSIKRDGEFPGQVNYNRKSVSRLVDRVIAQNIHSNLYLLRQYVQDIEIMIEPDVPSTQMRVTVYRKLSP